MNRKNSVFDGFIRDNSVLSGLMVISPIIVCGDTVMNAIAMIYAFSAITFISVLAGAFIPKKFSYGVKTIILAAIGAAVYIPVKFAADEFFSFVMDRIGIYFMLIAVNSLITVHAQVKFYRMPKRKMIVSLISHILGFDVVMLILSVIRELLSHGTFCGRIVDADVIISGLSMPFGGFILLGLCCGIYRSIVGAVRENDDVSGGDSDVSGF